MKRGEAIFARVDRFGAPVIAKLLEWGYIAEWPWEITREGWSYLRHGKPKLSDFDYQPRKRR